VGKTVTFKKNIFLIIMHRVSFFLINGFEGCNIMQQKIAPCDKKVITETLKICVPITPCTKKLHRAQKNCTVRQKSHEVGIVHDFR